jgi:hypothetical protein
MREKKQDVAENPWLPQFLRSRAEGFPLGRVPVGSDILDVHQPDQPVEPVLQGMESQVYDLIIST